MKIGAMNNPGKKLGDQLDELNELSFQLIELTIEGPQATPDKIDPDQVKEFVEENDIELIGHLPWEINLGTPYKTYREGAVEFMIELLDFAEKLGINYVTTHARSVVSGSYKRNYKDKLMESLVKSSQKLVEEAEKKDITLGIENEPGGIEIWDFPELFDQVPEAKMTLDIGHAFIEPNEIEDIQHFIGDNQDRIEHIHLSDNFGQDDDHLPLGAGEIQWKKILKTLKQIEFEGNITAEIHSRDTEYLFISKRKLERHWTELFQES